MCYICPRHHNYRRKLTNSSPWRYMYYTEMLIYKYTDKILSGNLFLIFLHWSKIIFSIFFLNPEYQKNIISPSCSHLASLPCCHYVVVKIALLTVMNQTTDSMSLIHALGYELPTSDFPLSEALLILLICRYNFDVHVAWGNLLFIFLISSYQFFIRLSICFECFITFKQKKFCYRFSIQ